MVNISGIFPANWVIIYHRSHLLRVNVPKRPWGILNQKMHHGLNSSDESFSFETEHFNHWFVDQGFPKYYGRNPAITTWDVKIPRK